MATATASRGEVIERSIDKNAAGKLEISRTGGGMEFRSMSEVMEFAKLLSVSQQAVPTHCRNNVGICLGITIQAIEWRMSPYAVASKSYVVNDRLGYESQLVHAVIEQRAPIQGRLRHEFSGAGDKRRCRVWATPKGESEPVEYTSPEFGTITPKNSPLWKSKPDLQLYYNTSRDWARVYFPDVLLGVYADDELAGMVVEQGGAELAGMAGLKQKLALQLERSQQETAANGDVWAGDEDVPHEETGQILDDDTAQAPAEENAIVTYWRKSLKAQKTVKGRGDVLAEASKQLDADAMRELSAFAEDLSGAK